MDYFGVCPDFAYIFIIADALVKLNTLKVEVWMSFYIAYTRFLCNNW